MLLQAIASPSNFAQDKFLVQYTEIDATHELSKAASLRTSNDSSAADWLTSSAQETLKELWKGTLSPPSQRLILHCAFVKTHSSHPHRIASP